MARCGRSPALQLSFVKLLHLWLRLRRCELFPSRAGFTRGARCCGRGPPNPKCRLLIPKPPSGARNLFCGIFLPPKPARTRSGTQCISAGKWTHTIGVGSGWVVGPSGRPNTGSPTPPIHTHQGPPTAPSPTRFAFNPITGTRHRRPPLARTTMALSILCLMRPGPGWPWLRRWQPAEPPGP